LVWVIKFEIKENTVLCVQNQGYVFNETKLHCI
jgi:hypothetical protein